MQIYLHFFTKKLHFFTIIKFTRQGYYTASVVGLRVASVLGALCPLVTSAVPCGVQPMRPDHPIGCPHRPAECSGKLPTAGTNINPLQTQCPLFLPAAVRAMDGALRSYRRHPRLARRRRAATSLLVPLGDACGHHHHACPETVRCCGVCRRCFL